MGSFLQLPLELVEAVCSELPAKDALALSSTCHALRASVIAVRLRRPAVLRLPSAGARPADWLAFVAHHAPDAAVRALDLRPPGAAVHPLEDFCGELPALELEWARAESEAAEALLNAPAFALACSALALAHACVRSDAQWPLGLADLRLLRGCVVRSGWRPPPTLARLTMRGCELDGAAGPPWPRESLVRRCSLAYCSRSLGFAKARGNSDPLLPALEELELTCSAVDPIWVAALLHAAPKLRSLDLSYSSGLEDADELAAVLAALPRGVEVLRLAGLAVPPRLLDALPSGLVSVSLASCDALRGEAACAWALARAGRLRDLDLANVPFDEDAVACAGSLAAAAGVGVRLAPHASELAWAAM